METAAEPLEPLGPLGPVAPGATSEPVGSAVDEAKFRTVLGHFATGVTVVTGQAAGGPVGLAANAFASVSLDPPLVLVCLARTSNSWPKIRDSGAFAVNVLSERQEEVSRRFGDRGGDRFAGLGWKPGDTGSPVFSDALAFVECRIEAEYAGGDHVIVVGRVVDLGVIQEGRPLIFWRGGYGSLAR
jgi:3-hydroxy-9,10-secoandrosta-1,3,5(10)-triene-9,17-dione monooxygenase reductase component